MARAGTNLNRDERVSAWTDRLLGRWMDLLRRRAVLVLLAGLVLSAVSATYAARNLAIDTSTTNMISAEVPFRRNYIAFRQAFPDFVDPLVVVIDAPIPEQAQAVGEALADTLRARDDLFEAVMRPGSDPYFRRNGLLFLDADALSRLADRLAGAEPLLATLAEDPSARGLYDAIGLALTVGADQLGDGEDLADVLDRIGDVLEKQIAGQPGALSWSTLVAPSLTRSETGRDILLVQPVLDHSGLTPADAAMNTIRALAADIGATPENGATVRLTGPAALDQEELRDVEAGASTAGLVSLALVTLLLIVGLRSPGLIVATVATLLMGLIWTAGFATLTIGHLNLISVAFAVLFVGLAVDFSIHFGLRCQEEGAQGLSGGASLKAAAPRVAGALLLSAVCAAAGFYSFLPTDYLGLAELGFISGSGMFIAMLANFTVFPALMALIAGKPGKPAPPAVTKPAAGGPITRLHRPIIVCAAIAGIGAAAALPFARFDFNPLNLKNPDSESVSTFLDIAGQDGAVYAIDLLTDSLDTAAEAAARLDRLEQVSHAISLLSFVPADQDEKLQILDELAIFLAPLLEERPQPPALGAADHARALQRFRDQLDGFLGMTARKPGRLEASAERLASLLDRFVGADGADASDLDALDRRLTGYLPRLLADLRTAMTAGPVAVADIPDSLRRQWVTDDGKARVQVLPAPGTFDNAALREFADAVFVAEPAASGGPVTINQAGKVVVSAFREATLWAIASLVVLLMLVLRSLAGVLLVMAPLILAALLMTAIAVLLGLSFNFANIIVLPLLFGLGVSSAIHLVVRHRKAADTAAVMTSSTPRAVLFSTLTTIASFGSLMVSGHIGMVSMGQLLTIALGCTLLCTLIVLPALMTWIDGRTSARAN